MASWLVYEVVQYTSSDFMTQRPLPVFDIEHAQWNQHMAFIGVMDRRGQ